MTGIITNIVSFIIILILLFVVNNVIGIIVFLSIPIYIVFYLLLKKPLLKLNYNYKEKQSIFFSKLNEQIIFIKFIKRNVLFNFFSSRLVKTFNELYKAIMKYFKLAYLTYTSNHSPRLNIFFVAYFKKCKKLLVF